MHVGRGDHRERQDAEQGGGDQADRRAPQQRAERPAQDDLERRVRERHERGGVLAGAEERLHGGERERDAVPHLEHRARRRLAAEEPARGLGVLDVVPAEEAAEEHEAQREPAGQEEQQRCPHRRASARRRRSLRQAAATPATNARCRATWNATPSRA